jgi:AraC family transcriptional regulator, regulatory protein of adaptative response / DNA-3-methyladenine glycosylase II
MPVCSDRGGDLTTVIARLVALPGIGPWTANYIAMRALRQADAFPESDLGLLRAATKAGHERLRPTELLQMAEQWRPLRAYAAMQLWLSEYPSTSRCEEAVTRDRSFRPSSVRWPFRRVVRVSLG